MILLALWTRGQKKGINEQEKYKMKTINAKIVADSISEQGHRITSMLLTYPRFIHGEIMTHRLFSRNSASSRAIPFEKMVRMVEEDPFIPIAWQKDHRGMQGSEYLNGFDSECAKEDWLTALDYAVSVSKNSNKIGVTKQLCNRLLEPFMWHTTLVTATEWDNFFELRCPRYEFDDRTFKSTKDVCNYIGNCVLVKMDGLTAILTSHDTTYQTTNISQAEIHIQALAESMWDAMNDSTPKKLEAGEWHIPFDDRMDVQKLGYITGSYNYTSKENIDARLKINVARAARLSYMTHDGEINYEKDIKLHDQLLKDSHMSPFEHCSRAMNEDELDQFEKVYPRKDGKGGFMTFFVDKESGWCNNFRGWIQYRYLVENNIKL